MVLLNSYFNIKRWKLFTGIVFINLLLIFLSQITLVNEVVFYNTYSDQFTYDRALEIFNRLKSYCWTAYILAPLLLLIKFSALSILIYIGIFFADMQKQISLGMVLSVVISSEAVFILASAAKFIWFMFFAGNYTLDDISFFYPLSLVNIFQQTEISSYWIYPLQTVNLFQVAYILMLSAGLSSISGAKRAEADRIILMTYVPAMVVWIAFVMFISIDTTI
jgi:hypothetical protein